MKLPFRSRPDDDELDDPVAQPQRNRPIPKHEQRLMFEASTHWGRGLAIILAMAATLIAFLVILTVLPRPGTGNPLDTLTGANNSSATTPVAALAGASPTPVLATVVRGQSGAASTGTPGPRWVASAPRGANVRAAPNTNNNPLGVLAPGRQVEIIGKSPDLAWYQIVWDNNVKAWVAQELMTIVTGDVNQIPVVRTQ